MSTVKSSDKNMFWQNVSIEKEKRNFDLKVKMNISVTMKKKPPDQFYSDQFAYFTLL